MEQLELKIRIRFDGCSLPRFVGLQPFVGACDIIHCKRGEEGDCSWLVMAPARDVGGRRRVLRENKRRDYHLAAFSTTETEMGGE